MTKSLSFLSGIVYICKSLNIFVSRIIIKYLFEWANIDTLNLYIQKESIFFYFLNINN